MDARVLARFGVFVREGFLDEAACETLRREMEGGVASSATVAGGAYGESVDEEQRRTKYVDVSDEAFSATEQRLLGLRPELEQHFELSLSGMQPPQFLRYDEGDHFGAHRDSTEDDDAPEFARQRALTAIVFVNAPSDEPTPGRYGGGELSLYGLMQGRPEVGLPVSAKPGLLVAFPSETLHGVSPVTHGERYTIAAWFY